MRTWRWRKDALGVFSQYVKRHKSVYIFVNNNTNVNFLKILSNYTIWDRLSQKSISRYCPFKIDIFSGHTGWGRGRRVLGLTCKISGCMISLYLLPAVQEQVNFSTERIAGVWEGFRKVWVRCMALIMQIESNHGLSIVHYTVKNTALFLPKVMTAPTKVR